MSTIRVSLEAALLFEISSLELMQRYFNSLTKLAPNIPSKIASRPVDSNL